MKHKITLQKKLHKSHLLKAAKIAVQHTQNFPSIIKQLSLKIVYPQAIGFGMNLLQTISYQQQKVAYTVIKQELLIPKLKPSQPLAQKTFKKTASPLTKSEI